MSKPFYIPDWQDKQRRLAEREAVDTGMDQELDDITKSRIAFYPKDKQYDSPEGEGKMAKGDAIELAKDAKDVAEMIGPDTNLPEWVEAKITKAADYLNDVKDYLSNYDASRGEEQSPTLNEDIYQDEDQFDPTIIGSTAPVSVPDIPKLPSQPFTPDIDPEEDPEVAAKQFVKKMHHDVALILKYIPKINFKSEWLELFDYIAGMTIPGLSRQVQAQTLKEKAVEMLTKKAPTDLKIVGTNLWDLSPEDYEDKIGENTLATAGSGVSAPSGPGFEYMTPNAFKKKGKNKKIGK